MSYKGRLNRLLALPIDLRFVDLRVRRDGDFIRKRRITAPDSRVSHESERLVGRSGRCQNKRKFSLAARFAAILPLLNRASGWSQMESARSEEHTSELQSRVD